MKIVQEQILFECLEQFEAGASVASLVAKYPHAAEEIEKFLAVAVHLQQRRLQPGLAAKQQSEKLFLQEAARLRSGQRKAWFAWGNLQRTLLPLASLAMVTVLFGATFLFASASAMPGDLLYNAKRWAESYQLEQAGDATAVFSLNTQMNQERVREVKAVLRTNETADVSFEGRVNTRQGSNWIIAGIPVAVNEQTQVEGYVSVGALVLVHGRTHNGHLYASRIIVLQEVAATAMPTATTTSTATATPTTTMTNTPTPTPTTTTTLAVSATPTATSTPTATPTATAVPPTPTTEPTSMPTAVVNNDDDDDGNDNSGDDNQNDNSGGGSNDNDSNDNSGGNPGSNDNGNDNSGDDNGNSNSGDDNGNENAGGNNNDNGNDNSGGDNGNDNDDDNDNGNGNDNGDNSGGGSSNDNSNDNSDNGNENGRRDDD